MLVLTRKLGESIDIDGGTVTITVLSVASGQIKLGVVAPADVTVHRAEVARRIMEAGEDPRVRQVPGAERAGEPVTRPSSLWDSAARRLTAEALRMRREDEAAADAEAERERREEAQRAGEGHA